MTVTHPDWALSKAIELFSAVNGQEDGSYSTAKAMYSIVGDGNKLIDINNKNKEVLIINELDQCRSDIDIIPLYEDREGYSPSDWERRKQSLSNWLINITSVEGMYLH